MLLFKEKFIFIFAIFFLPEWLANVLSAQRKNGSPAICMPHQILIIHYLCLLLTLDGTATQDGFITGAFGEKKCLAQLSLIAWFCINYGSYREFELFFTKFIISSKIGRFSWISWLKERPLLKDGYPWKAEATFKFTVVYYRDEGISFYLTQARYPVETHNHWQWRRLIGPRLESFRKPRESWVLS